MKNGIGNWIRRDAEGEDLAGFTVTVTYDQSTNIPGYQKY
jgi:hypothetical protein